MRKYKYLTQSKSGLFDGKSKPPEKKEEYVNFNFKDLDQTQSATFEVWEESGLLSKA
jgi:hypothetical protein